jgi:hypothetical protein
VVVSERLRCAFVHVQKTGGESLEGALLDADPEAVTELPGNAAWEDPRKRRHLYAADLAAALGASRWEELFSFGFVRNPWERLVSWHSMCLERPEINEFTRQVASTMPDFAQFAAADPDGPAGKATVSQLDYLDGANGARLVSFIGRYENLEADVAAIADRIGVPLRLPHANRSDHRDYRDYYSDRTRMIVAERFARDIEEFGYRF